jgi:UDP-N-acetylglucosamine--N-acetylmuramyl-(pentapeptide) pyrophosphoryl-undecaprenol N-acetylglucosamine transferase
VGSYRVILSGGGTGGHIYPAIAIANEIKRRYPDTEFLFVGAKDKMEMEKVPQAGYKIKGLWISGLQRRLTFKNVLFPIKLIHSLLSARKIVNRFEPHVAIGTGGFASGPLLKVASQKEIPYVLQEQNSFAGITNKLLANKAAKICVAYDGMERYFPKEKIAKTGNPVRADLVNPQISKEQGAESFGLNSQRPILLILGGSLGARRINQLVESKLGFFERSEIQVLWQCGKLYEAEYKKHLSENVRVVAFINELHKAFAAADIIISRAGASSVSELCIVGKPVLFVPSPNVAEDHQTKNAMALVKEDAAVLLKESQLDTEFEPKFKELMDSQAKRETLGRNIRKLALPKATEHIVNEIEKLLK